MDFNLTEEQIKLKMDNQRFIDKWLSPEQVRKYDEAGEMPDDLLEAAREFGFFAMTVPEKYGGAEMDYMSFGLTIEQLSKACAGFGITVAAHLSLACNVIQIAGTDEQKNVYLPKMADGIASFLLTEPGAGSDLARIVTEASLDGDSWVISGDKCFVTSGGLAKYLVVFCRTDPESKGTNKGISAIIVESNTPGITISKPEEKLGIRCSNTVSVTFNSVRVPAENLIGGDKWKGKGLKLAYIALDDGRLGVAAQALGIGQAALKAGLAYSTQREQSGGELCNNQLIQEMLADMATDVRMTQLLLYEALAKRDAGERVTMEAAMVKVAASEMAVQVAAKALQIHGGNGFMMDYDVQRYVRDAFVTRIYEGGNEVLIQLIAAWLTAPLLKAKKA